MSLATAYARYSDILCTNTFGGNALRLAAFGLEDQVRAINNSAVQLALESVRPAAPTEGRTLVAGVMGPARGPNRSEISEGELFNAFRVQAECLAEAGADFLLLETMTDVGELSIALKAVAAGCDLETVCSYAFRACESGAFQTWAGDDLERALETAYASGAVMVGANCVPANSALVQLIENMRAVAGAAPLWLKPNAGQPIDVHSPTGPRRMYPHTFSNAPIDALLDALGQGVIGGCCGTSPSDIAALRHRLDLRISLSRDE